MPSNDELKWAHKRIKTLERRLEVSERETAALRTARDVAIKLLVMPMKRRSEERES